MDRILPIACMGVVALCCLLTVIKENKKHDTALMLVIFATCLLGYKIDAIHFCYAGTLLPYFTLQSISDIKEEHVYKLLNVVTLLSVGITHTALVWEYIDWKLCLCYAVTLVVVFLLGFVAYGSGDAKCLAIMFFVTYFFTENPEQFANHIVTFLLYVLVSNVVFLVYAGIKRIKNKAKTRYCYFPALYVGYLIFLIVGV